LSHTDAFLIGDVTVAEILGGYRLATMLATGQTSQVWEVVEMSSSRHFAMKLLLPEFATNEMHRKHLFHEAEVGLKLAHANIVRILKVSKDPKNPFFIMEYFPGGSLKARLLRKDQEFIFKNAQSIVKQAATGLAFMNALKYVHRDVKPDNILVSSGGDLKLIDFAISQRIKKPGFFDKMFKKKGKVAGTRSYMSPEQIRGEFLDGRADIYSFGATCYELFTGRPPFRADNAQELLRKHILEKPQSPKTHNANITDEFADLVLKMLAKKPADRPHDFHEVLKKLQTIRILKPESPAAKK
jgi:eukaryotic-like serine/threonine-protein kinase